MFGWRRKFLGFRPAKTVRFSTLSMISHAKAVYFKTFFSPTQHLETSGWVRHEELHRFTFIDRHKCIYLIDSKSAK